MQLGQLIYYSRNTAEQAGDRSQLELMRSILAASRRNNVRDGLTGFLLFDRTWFVQILEGDRATMMPAYDRIKADHRHSDVTLLALRDIRRRSFPRWSMAGLMRDVSQQEIFLRHGISGPLDPNRLLAPVILALALELQDFEIAREAAALRPTG